MRKNLENYYAEDLSVPDRTLGSARVVVPMVHRLDGDYTPIAAVKSHANS